MKKSIHPEYFENAEIICACGNVIKTGAAVKEMKVEICSACHPLYTGKKKIFDTTGRVDRFKKLAEKTAAKKSKAPKKAGRGGIKTKAGKKKKASKKVK